MFENTCRIGGTAVIGYTPENKAREFRFDVGKWQAAWPDATPEMLVVRPDEDVARPVPTRVEKNWIVWMVSRYDTAIPGLGRMWVVFHGNDGETLGETPATMIRVMPGPPNVDGEEPPETETPWVSKVLDAAKRAEDAADRAENAGGTGEGGGGTPGANGEDGGYYIPSMNADGDLIWTASKEGMPDVPGANIKGPKGDAGERGLTGEQGPVGPTGATGETGPQGPKGEKGDKGENGETGPQGPAGTDGAKGDKGDTGEQGPKGDKGDPGEAGPQGPAGTDGKAATLEIVGADSLPYGSVPTVTEADGSTAQSRLYRLGIPEGKPGGSTGGAAIDDTTPSANTTYSSRKIDELLNEQKEANEQQNEVLAQLDQKNVAQDEEISKKANDSDLAPAAKSGNYEDLKNKPTIPTVPSALPNPYPLTINGTQYDGSKAVAVTVEGGGDAPGGGSTGGYSEWRLFKSFTVPAAAADGASGVNWLDMSSGGVLWGFDTDDDGNPFSFDEIIVVSKMGGAGTNVTDPRLRFDSAIPAYNNDGIVIANGVENNSLSRWFAKIERMYDKYYWCEFADMANGVFYTNAPRWNQNIPLNGFGSKIDKIRIVLPWKLNNGLYEGSEFKFYGR